MSLREYEMVMKAVADPTRVRILKLLEGGEMCVCQVVAILELGQSTISRHLFLLKMAGLVRERQEKKWVHYALDGAAATPYARRMLAAVKGWLNDDPGWVPFADSVIGTTAQVRRFSASSRSRR